MSKLLAALAVLSTSTLASAQDTGRSGYKYGGNDLTTVSTSDLLRYSFDLHIYRFEHRVTWQCGVSSPSYTSY